MIQKKVIKMISVSKARGSLLRGINDNVSFIVISLKKKNLTFTVFFNHTTYVMGSRFYGCTLKSADQCVSKNLIENSKSSNALWLSHLIWSALSGKHHTSECECESIIQSIKLKKPTWGKAALNSITKLISVLSLCSGFSNRPSKDT